MRAGDAVLAIAALTALLDGTPAAALGIRYPDPVPQAVGVAGRPGLCATTPVWWLEVSQQQLFLDTGLAATGVRAGTRARGALLAAEVTQLAATVGRETGAVVRVGCETSRGVVVTALSWDSTSLEGGHGAWVLASGIQAAVAASHSLQLVFDIDGYRLAGVEWPGADMSAATVVSTSTGARFSGAFVVDRGGAAFARVAAAVELKGRAAIAVGYDDGNESLSFAISVLASGARAAAGIRVHPVLGVSRGVSVGWVR